MKKPLLSICIPTYNRSEQLKNTLDSIICQEEFVNGSVEIVISDNNSEDDTLKVVEKYQQYDNIYYFRNNNNIGSENFPLALSRGNGELRKLNNDTLIHKQGSLKLLCEVINKYKDIKPYLYFSNGNNYEKKIVADKVISFSEFVVQASFGVTWIGSFSIWEDEIKKLDTQGCDLKLWQVKKAYELASCKNECVIVDIIMGNIQEVTKKSISYGLHKVFYTNFLSLLIPYVKNGIISETSYEEIRKDLLFNFFTDWIIEWELGNNKLQYSEEENLKLRVFQEYKNTKYWKNFL